jgi:hypothetical protein
MWMRARHARTANYGLLFVSVCDDDDSVVRWVPVMGLRVVVLVFSLLLSHPTSSGETKLRLSKAIIK